MSPFQKGRWIELLFLVIGSNSVHTYHYAHTHIDQIDDQDLRGLFDEIAGLRGITKDGYVIHFLVHSLHPSSSKKKEKFIREEFKTEYYLRQRIGKLKDTAIYNLCMDLVAMFKKGHIENFHGVALYVFLNRVIPDNNKLGKRKQR